jgi:hypothetical protein
MLLQMAGFDIYKFHLSTEGHWDFIPYFSFSEKCCKKYMALQVSFWYNDFISFMYIAIVGFQVSS